MRLPLATPQPADPSEPASRAEPRQAGPAEGLRVLVVDDNVDAAKSMGMVLELLGVANEVQFSGRAALEAVITPEDVAETAWYLGASAAKTTGEVMLVDAGLRITKI